MARAGGGRAKEAWRTLDQGPRLRFSVGRAVFTRTEAPLSAEIYWWLMAEKPAFPFPRPISAAAPEFQWCFTVRTQFRC